MRGVEGRLVTASFARDLPSVLAGARPMPPAVRRGLLHWWRRCESSLGPASAARAVADVALLPLLRLLGYQTFDRGRDAGRATVEARTHSAAILCLAFDWRAPLTRSWRDVVSQAVAADVRWCFCCNGTALRIVDGTRTWSRDHLEFDLASLAEEEAAQDLFWAVASADSMKAVPPLMDRAAALSARHGRDVCGALGEGVLEALRLLVSALSPPARTRHAADLLFEQSLTVLYRILFLLFAEGRDLVPLWHRVYRDRYSLEGVVTALLAGRRYRGLWPAIQAISRLAHAGCVAGELKVTAFNGRLFAPTRSSEIDRRRLDDDVMGRVVIAVGAASDRQGRRWRIAYRDLDVEQLGAVYERVLDYRPAPPGSPDVLERSGDRRKASGTFYTPRAVTAFLVRQTLEPLVAGRSSSDVLRLRIVDPAMGSGAFLVASCRYLAGALEDALVREGTWHPHDVAPSDRVALRREVASRCLYGVDSNPMAVQLAALSMWLATLSGDKPLSFLEHRLVVGDSLVGASPEDVRRQPAGSGRRQRRHDPLPLFGEHELTDVLRRGVRTREHLAATADDSVAIVRAKEQALAELRADDAGSRRWARVLDLWCAGWFWINGRPPDRRTFGALTDDLLRGRRSLPSSSAAALLAESEAIGDLHRFLHWTLAFPEVFADADGVALPSPGFDAVVGNPPWDMVRGDSGDGAERENRRRTARQLAGFVRESGVYRVDLKAHPNRYQLFVERALQLVRTGGRIGLVLPSGMASDAGAAPLRRYLMDRAAVDAITGLDNREAIFPIHRSLRFVLLTATAGPTTAAIQCRFAISRPDELEKPSAAHAPIVLTRRFLARLSGEDDLGIPELTGTADLRLLERISVTIPRLGARDGWRAAFGRELNATDDRAAFVAAVPGSKRRVVVEGKQIEPFRTALDRSRLQVGDERAVAGRAPRRRRLAYRDVASATNRLTLIAAIIPPGAVTTHTLFCLRTPMTDDAQHVLCALMNSFVANYLVRLRVNTHVTVSLVSRLPVPLVTASDTEFKRLAALSRALAAGTGTVEGADEYAELQAIAAHLYGLTAEDFEYVLTTFPLVRTEAKQRALAVFHV